MPNKFIKIKEMVRLLENDPVGLSAQQLADRLKVDKRTIKRYLAEIRGAGFLVNDLREASNAESRLVIIDARKPPAHFIPGLKNIQREMQSWGNPKFVKFIDQVLHYLERMNGSNVAGMGEPGSLPADDRNEAGLYYIDHGPFSQEAVPAGLLKKLEAAVQDSLRIRVTYSGYRREKEEFDFFPYRLSLRVGTLYLIGRRDKNNGTFKSLALKRISRCSTFSDTFRPDDFNPAEYYQFCFGQFPRQAHERPAAILLKINEPWLQKFLEESHFSPPGRFIRSGREVFFELLLVIKPDFINWVVSLSPFMTPVKPQNLVTEVRKRLEEGLGKVAEETR